MGYVFGEMTDEGTVMAYPDAAPYTMRDQSARNGDDTVRVVIGDVADVLAAADAEGMTREEGETYGELAKRAQSLYVEACSLFGDDYGWLDGDESENLRGILEEAENLPGVHVEWCGDAGTVYVTLADSWQEMSEDEARAAGIGF